MPSILPFRMSATRKKAKNNRRKIGIFVIRRIINKFLLSALSLSPDLFLPLARKAIIIPLHQCCFSCARASTLSGRTRAMQALRQEWLRSNTTQGAHREQEDKLATLQDEGQGMSPLEQYPMRAPLPRAQCWPEANERPALPLVACLKASGSRLHERFAAGSSWKAILQ